MATFVRMMFVVMFTLVSFTGASAQVSEKVFSDFDTCWAQKVPYYPTLNKPMNRGQRMTLEQIDPVFKVGTCVRSPEVVEMRDGKPILVTGWVFLPGHFELAKVGESYYMQQCSNSIAWIGPPEGWAPKPATVVATNQASNEEGEILLATNSQPAPMQLAVVGDGYAPIGGAVTQSSSGGVNGWAVAGIALGTAAVAYTLGRDNDDGDVTNNITNINNGQCAGANVTTTGDGNIVCSNVTTTQPPSVCNAPNRVIGGVCTTPPVCQGSAVLDQNSFTCQCLAPNQVINGVCTTPSLTCTIPGQTVVNGTCQCPSGQQVINGSCQVPPIVCTIPGQQPINGACQCPQGQQVINGSCQVPVQYCPDGSVRPANGQCPLVCIGGKIPVNGTCQCPAGQEEYAGVCRIPLPQCSNGQILIGGICQCPVGQQFVGGFCQQVPQCRVDQILVNNVCQCPIGQAEIGGYCQQPLVCIGGKIPVNGTCQCPAGQEEYAGVCRIPLPPGGGMGGTGGTCPTGQVMVAGVCRDPLPGG